SLANFFDERMVRDGFFDGSLRLRKEFRLVIHSSSLLRRRCRCFLFFSLRRQGFEIGLDQQVGLAPVFAEFRPLTADQRLRVLVHLCQLSRRLPFQIIRQFFLRRRCGFFFGSFLFLVCRLGGSLF